MAIDELALIATIGAARLLELCLLAVRPMP
jgi:hypothetical protein